MSDDLTQDHLVSELRDNADELSTTTAEAGVAGISKNSTKNVFLLMRLSGAEIYPSCLLCAGNITLSFKYRCVCVFACVCVCLNVCLAGDVGENI